MRKGLNYALSIAIVCAMAFILPGCDSGSSLANRSSGNDSGVRKTATSVLAPEASGETVYEDKDATIDASNTSDGYVMIKYSGKSSKIKIQITGPDETIYTYTSHAGEYETFPLTVGSGAYRIDVLENISDDLYFLSQSQTIDVNIENEFAPFLYPNQYIWYVADSKAVELGRQLSDQSESDLDYVSVVYDYVISNITYDNDKAANVPIDYIPDIDETLTTGKGICFDYASLMSAILRSQNIPTKLVVGYSGPAYHAWISVWLEETGWVDNIIEFDGTNWSIMDPTLGAGNGKEAVKEYVGDGTNYTAKYHY